MSAVAPAERVLELAMAVRQRVLPFLGAHSGRSLSGEGAGGDITFAIDSLAEEALDELVPERTAFYSEDRGLVAPPDAIDGPVVAPSDGTGPTMAGLESACVAGAPAPTRERE